MKYLFLLLPLLLLTACQDDDDMTTDRMADLSIRFRAEYAATGLDIGRTTYAYPQSSDSLRLTLFEYFLSDLSLLPADGGDPIRLSELQYVSYEQAEGPSEQTVTFPGIPVGDYRGISFGLGVKPELNNLDPAELPEGLPLTELQFWNERARYVFAKIEANAKLQGSNRFDTGLTYHLGGNDLYETVVLETPFTVSSDRRNSLMLLADVTRVFGDENDTPFDIRDPETQRIHGGNQAAAAVLWERLGEQFVLLEGQ